MFSRNRFNGQHGAGVSPKAGAKAKVHTPKKRAPNPRVALVIRGKIHRLLQGSADHHVPDPHLSYAGIEQEEEGEAHESRKELRSVYPKANPGTEALPPRVSIIKRHVPASGPPCVGEVELNREGCIRIPCTLQHKSCRPPTSQKRISFESGLREAPESMRRIPQYAPVDSDMNGMKFASGTRDYASPRIRPKRPYSAGDCVDYNFNRALPNTLLEEDEDKDEASSAIIDHILKELKGINKIQEEISDLRDYLTSVRGSVEEVSSCVDAVLLEIEGIRSTNKGGSGTWSGIECKDGQFTRRRPASAYGSLGSPVPKTDSNCFPPVCTEHRNIPRELLLTRPEKSNVSQVLTSTDQESEEPDDTSDHSSDIPEGATARKLSFGFLEQLDGQDCPSMSSLSSGHSSKSESDLERLLSTHARKEQRVEDGEEHWSNTVPPQSVTRESMWRRERTYLRDRDRDGDDGALCCEGTGGWDHYRGAGGYGTSVSCFTGSSEHLSMSSGKHYNSPASSSSREEWQSRMRRPQSQSRIHDPTSSNSTVGYECSADLSYPQSSGYHSVDGHDGEAEEFDFEQTNELSYTTNCEIEMYLAYEESSAVTCSEGSGVTPFIQKNEASSESLGNRPPQSGGADIQAEGFTVKRIGRAVLDFSSALRGALRKLEVPAAVNPGEETDFDISVPSDPPTTELPSKSLSYEANVEQTFHTQRGDIVRRGYDSEELTKDHTIDKSKSFSVEHVLDETNNGLKMKSAESVCLDKISSYPEDLTIRPGTSVPDGLVEKLTESSAEEHLEDPADASLKAQLSQCTTAESLSFSVLADASATLEEEEPTEVPQQSTTDVAGGPEVKPEENAAEQSTDLNQMDERKLKCLRTFQEILREKRETRRNLVSMTMSSFSQDDLEPDGSQDGDQVTSSVFPRIKMQI